MEQAERTTLDRLVPDTGAFDPATALTIRRYGNDGATDTAIVIPVHNQGGIIARVLDGVVGHAVLRHEIVLIIDGCSDDTLDVVTAWAAKQSYEAATVRMIVVEAPTGVFETISDAIGIALTSAPWIIEVQADLFLEDPAFDRILVRALEQNPDVLAVSGRGGHRSPRVPRRTDARAIVRRIGDAVLTRWWARRPFHRTHTLQYLLSDQVGRCGDLIEKPIRLTGQRSLYLHDTVMRGPLALSRARYVDVGGFDTTHFFLGDDDHDLFARAAALHGLRVGYVPVVFSSPLDLGSTRRVRPAEEQARFDALRVHYAHAADESFLATGRVVADLPRAVRPIRVTESSSV